MGPASVFRFIELSNFRVKEAKENLAKGDLIPTKDYHGAARLREKTPQEVAAEHEARKITV